MKLAQPEKKKKKLNADTGDGTKHINIWINGQTELGRMLAHFYYLRFVHPVLGSFNSMEGLWHYVKTKEKDDTLRKLSGIKAKEYGKNLTRQHVKNFQEIIVAANFYKIEQNEYLKGLMLASDLPFEFYYLHGPENVVIKPTGYDWLIEGFEAIRTMLREGRRPEDIDYSQILKKELT